MKTLFIVTFLLLTLNLSSNDELEWVDEQINAIKPPRVGVKSIKIARLKSPFIFLRKKGNSKNTTARRRSVIPNGMMASSRNKTKKAKKAKVVKRGLYLGAVLNDTALISGKWYKINDKVGAYTLTSVSRTSVVLSGKKKSLTLSTDSKNLNLKFKNK